MMKPPTHLLQSCQQLERIAFARLEAYHAHPSPNPLDSSTTHDAAHRRPIGARLLDLLSEEEEEIEIKMGIVGNPRLGAIDEDWLFMAKPLWLLAEKLWSNGKTKLEFRALLSTEDYHAFTMLQEWIHSEFESEDVVRELYAFLYHETTLAHAHADSNHGQPRYAPFTSDVFKKRTLYHLRLMDLFLREFAAPLWPLNDDYWLIREREVAWEARTAQRVYRHFKLTQWAEGLKASSNHLAFSNPLPRTDYCRWLERDFSGSKFPRYLWHLSSKKTIDTNELPVKVDYSCVSHTWGRWRQAAWVQIPDVPWKVPLNDRFDVVKLPQTFFDLRYRFTTEYLWFDLFCIPQESGDPHLAAICTQEIAKQATIFQNAKACIAWLNYIDDWTAEYSTLGWLAIKSAELSARDGKSEFAELLEVAAQDCEVPLRLTNPPSQASLYSKWRNKLKLGKGQDSEWTPSDWFMGVWTLQEAYLRPNMILANSTWNTLCDPAGQPVSLEELFTISEIVTDLAGARSQPRFFEVDPFHDVMDFDSQPGLFKRFPLGPRQLWAVVKKTKLTFKDSLCRIDPIFQATERFCTSGRCGRAEAIMSSMGVTDWFNSDSKIKENDLVLGAYPLAFLEESARKIGPDFFMTAKQGPAAWKCLLGPFNQHAGSLLPFERPKTMKHTRTKRNYISYSKANNLHPSVRTWEYQLNGSARVRQAAILASSIKNDDNSLLNDKIVMYRWRTKSSIVNPSEWIQSQPKVFHTMLVCVNDGINWLGGIVLQGPKLGVKVTKLVKIGIFIVMAENAVPMSKSVDWIIV